MSRDKANDEFMDHAELEPLETSGEVITFSADPADWEDMSIGELKALYRYFFVLQAKCRHAMQRKEIDEGRDTFPERVPTHDDINTCSVLLTEKYAHGPAIAVAVSKSDKGWHVWQKDLKNPKGAKIIMQYAYIKQHLHNEMPVIIQMTSGKEAIKIATSKDNERIDTLRAKYGLPALP